MEMRAVSMEATFCDDVMGTGPVVVHPPAPSRSIMLFSESEAEAPNARDGGGPPEPRHPPFLSE